MVNSIVYNEDCMEVMARYPDKYFDLAVVDPPYGKKPTRDNKGNKGFNASKNYDNKANIWDVRPDKKYFVELFRISKNQVIWGANYLIEDLHSSNGWICWDKKNGENIFADFELAFTSFNSRARIFRLLTEKLNRFHPTQKPIKLYDWIYQNYLPQGGKVIDTHLGSGSNRIAAHKARNIDFVGCEIDKEYYDAQEKRFKEFTSQLVLW